MSAEVDPNPVFRAQSTPSLSGCALELGPYSGRGLSTFPDGAPHVFRRRPGLRAGRAGYGHRFPCPGIVSTSSSSSSGGCTDSGKISSSSAFFDRGNRDCSSPASSSSSSSSSSSAAACGGHDLTANAVVRILDGSTESSSSFFNCSARDVDAGLKVTFGDEPGLACTLTLLNALTCVRPLIFSALAAGEPLPDSLAEVRRSKRKQQAPRNPSLTIFLNYFVVSSFC